MNYNILGVRKAYRSLMYSKGDNYRKLTWLSKATPNAFIICVKISILPRTGIVFDPNNGSETLWRPFWKIVKSIIALTGLKGVEPSKFLRSRRFHFSFGEEDEKTYRISPPFGRQLKYGQIEMRQYPNKVGMKRESFAELQKGLRDRDVTSMRIVQSPSLL